MDFYLTINDNHVPLNYCGRLKSGDVFKIVGKQGSRPWYRGSGSDHQEYYGTGSVATCIVPLYTGSVNFFIDCVPFNDSHYSGYYIRGGFYSDAKAQRAFKFIIS